MPFTIRTAALTQKATACAFNGDSLNMNGRVLSADAANAGFRGAGKMASPFVLALASSTCNGVASAALTALNDRMPALKANCDSFPEILSDYFSDSSYALEKSGNAPDSLSVSVLFGYDDNLIAARMGNVRIYRWSAGELLAVGFVPESEDEEMPESSCELIEDIYDGDIYVLCTQGVWDNLTEEEIVAALRAAGDDEKQVVRAIAGAAVQKTKEHNVSVFVARVVSDIVLPTAEDDSDMRIAEPVTAAAAVQQAEEAAPEQAAPVQEEAADAYESSIYVPETEEAVYQPEEEYEEEEEEQEEAAAPSKSKKVLTVLLMVIGLLAAMAAVTFGAYKITYSRQHNGDTPAGLVGVGSQAQYDIDMQTTTVPATTEAPTTEAPTTEAPTTEAPTTDYYSYYNEYYATTEAPTTEAPTTYPSYTPTTEAPTEPVYDPSYEYPTDDPSEEEELPIPVQPDNPEGDYEY